MDQAKRNLVEKYLLVGTTEEIGDFVAILEATIPRIFKGATKLFNEGNFCILVTFNLFLTASHFFSNKCPNKNPLPQC